MANAALESLPEAIVCGKCRTRIFDVPANRHCPKCGAFLVDHTESLKDGRRARKALRREREADLAELRAKYLVDGRIDPVVDGICVAFAAARARLRLATHYSEDSAASVSDAKQQRAIKTAEDATDRIARLALALAQLIPPSVGFGPSGAVRVSFGGRYKGLPGVAPPTLRIEVEHVPTSPSQETVSSEPAVSAIDADVVDVVESEPVGEVVEAEPVRQVGLVAQWNTRVGSVRPDGGMGLVLLVDVADVGPDVAMAIGARVSFQRDGARAVDLRALEVEVGGVKETA